MNLNTFSVTKGGFKAFVVSGVLQSAEIIVSLRGPATRIQFSVVLFAENPIRITVRLDNIAYKLSYKSAFKFVPLPSRSREDYLRKCFQ
jgi:hypothetical protein